MVGQRLRTVNKPSRSDEVLDPAQQLQIADRVKAQYESLAPKRPTKPSRSEPDPDDSQAHQVHGGVPIPELLRLQFLNSQSQEVFPKGGGEAVQEEFVETQYYKQLVSIDKHHHTTGAGFIKMEKEGVENGWDSGFQRLFENGEQRSQGLFSGFKSNPATNDWTPSHETDNQAIYTSKPSRSG